ncbi:MAG: 2-oxoacid:acceptor oxidoreductase subunit alpha [Planctomycetes bacterium]|nr:2-oxoacid:acceptor oxidoreductase subunit alpha [Planctomycetota bacterium]
MESDNKAARPVETLKQAIIRFAGDSGDGMQITGSQFTNTSAVFGNDLATFPDYPAEIRAPAGTIPGVSGFQVRFSSFDIHTPGDRPDVLVAMNPAALKVNIKDLKPNGIVIVNTDNFGKQDLVKAKYEVNPLEDSTLDGFRVVRVPLNMLTKETLKDSGLDPKVVMRCKNFFALGIVYWLFQRPMETTVDYLNLEFGKNKKRPEIAEANIAAMKAGYNFADISGLFQVSYEVPRAKLTPGTYRNIQGNMAVGLGLLAASKLCGLPLFLGSYPITPASDILHQLSAYKNHGVITFQAEDEIAAICASIGASYAGNFAVTTTSGPGMALKSEALNLAIMTELPLVVVNVQRGGPSTGLPTKTEQSDLLQMMFGRNGDSPVPIIAASTSSDAFDCAIEASRLALKYMTPVILLTDGYIANGAEPWRLPKISDLPKIEVRQLESKDKEWYQPYLRDQHTLARPWAIPGTDLLQHRIGGLEKEDVTGNVSYDPANHQRMTNLRHEKVAGIAKDLPPFQLVQGQKGDQILVLGWGSTRGAITAAVESLREEGKSVAQAHLRYINPFSPALKEVLESFEHVLIPEMNMGQLAFLIQGKFAMKVHSYTKVTGLPFTTNEVIDKVHEILG